MKQTYEPVIGLEIHAELLTASKAFCSCSADYSSAPEANTNICPTCTGLPGALPVLNKKAVELSALVGLALNCSINPLNTFARKNYYYPDLPKGYQISQYELPIAEKGFLKILDGSMMVRIRRAHLEEDTAKLTHEKNAALVDFNRAGVPLLEIVSEPDMRSAEQALDYATKIRAILRYLGVNSGDMEKGVIRFEANVSVRPVGSDELRTRTEIKNLNSFRALTRAIDYEIQRQSKIYDEGGEVVQETLGWDDAHEATVSQRGKEDAHDYRYFPEPDLPPLRLDSEWVENLRARLPELPEAKTQRFTTQFGLSEKDARFLTSEKALADYFETTASNSKSPAKTVHSWLAGEFMHYLNDNNLDVQDVTLPPETFARLIDMVTEKIIGASAGKTVLMELLQRGGDPAQIVQEKNLAQLSDVDAIQELVAKILSDNPKEVEQYLAGKETLFQWFMGQVARASKGKADPAVAKELLMQALEERR